MDFEAYLAQYQTIVGYNELGRAELAGLRQLYDVTHADKIPMAPAQLNRDFMCFVIGRMTGQNEQLDLENARLRESLLGV
ncbi:MAG: hypothetical protein PHF67_02380 [Candidatus Nanoarchaeia archaeon]|nr:hypothetical protein [Candidatus Nanoarchaeia archaeon]